MSKKKIAIITRHAVPNYGSFLQSYATQCLIDEMDCTPTIIDYNRSDESAFRIAKSYADNSSNILKKIYYMTIWRFSNSCIDKKLMISRNKYLNLSKYVDEKTIKNIVNDYDILLTGSDQVWNIVGSGNTQEIDKNYFWDAANNDSYVISYAASFGDVVIKDDEKNKCCNLLKKYNSISIREDSGISIVNEMGLNATQVLDPTLSVDFKIWNNMAEKSNRKIKKKYALIYNLHSDSNMSDSIQESLKGSNIDVVSITTTFRRTPGKNIFCPTIEEFLYLFKNAECVYADSFHAIAFSLIFRTPFIVTLPKQYSTRLLSILRMFELTDRIYTENNQLKWNNTNIDWNRIYTKLEVEKKKSREWLNKAIQNFDNRNASI